MTASVYILNQLDGKRASTLGFLSKKEAKVERNRLLNEGMVCVVSRGPDHSAGPSQPDPQCRNTHTTAHKRQRRKRVDGEY